MRAALLIISLLGTLVFGSAFVVSIVDPKWVESTARELIRAEVERRVDRRIDALDNEGITGLAKQALRGNRDELERVRAIRAGLSDRVAAIAAEMGGYDCECQARIGRGLDAMLEGRAGQLSMLGQRLETSIRDAYSQTAAKLQREFRIFTGANVLVFILLGALALARRDSARELMLPALVLVGSAIITAGFYLFAQDWVRTIVFGDYLGYWYFGYLSLALGFLADVAMNRARVTTRLLNAVFSSVGGPAC